MGLELIPNSTSLSHQLVSKCYDPLPPYPPCAITHPPSPYPPLPFLQKKKLRLRRLSNLPEVLQVVPEPGFHPGLSDAKTFAFTCISVY